MGETSTHTFSKGMNQDISKSMVDQQTSFEIRNFHIVSGESTLTGILENVKGNKFLRNLRTTTGPSAVEFLYAGHIVMRDEVIFFVTLNTAAAPVGGGAVKSAIISVTFNTDTEAITAASTLYADYTYNSDSSYLNFSTANPITGVGVYESNDIKKIYWVDGYNKIRHANVGSHLTVDGEAYAGVGDYLPVDRFEFIPNSILPKVTLTDIVNGNIDAGIIQYTYQMYIKHGSQTSFAPLSDTIHISKESDFLSNSVYYKGSKLETKAGKAFKISIDNSNNASFNRIRIVALHRSRINDIPKIRIAAELAINQDEDTVTYIDSGVSIGELTLEQLLIPDTNIFKAGALETKHNLLFAADVEQDPFEIDTWDARTYRFNSSLIGRLENTNGSGYLIYGTAATKVGAGGAATLGDWEYFSSGTWDAANYAAAGSVNGASWTIPETADCINPFNNPIGEPYAAANGYKFQADGSTLGATGLNLSIRFGTENFNIETRDNVNYTGIDVEGSINNQSYRDYASPWKAGNERSWQRDEVYRIALTFYDDKMRKSFAYWTNDLKFPDFSNDGGNEYDLIVTGTPVEAMRLYPQVYMNNLPGGADFWQLVRVQRSINDRSILAQGLVSRVETLETTSLYQFKTIAAGDPSFKLISPEPTINKNLVSKAGDYVEYVGIYGAGGDVPDTTGTAGTNNTIVHKIIEFDPVSKIVGADTGHWIYPTGDANNTGWTDVSYIYDAGFDTFGYATNTGNTVEITHDGVISSKIGIFCDGDGGVGNQADLKIEVYYTAAYHTIHDALVPSGVFTEYEIVGDQTITKIKLTIRNNILARVRMLQIWDVAGLSNNKIIVTNSIILPPSKESVVLGSTSIENYETGYDSYGGTALFIEADVGSWEAAGVNWAAANYRRNLFGSQYGGYSYEARTRNEYIVGSGVSDATTMWTSCDIGDTFITYFEFLNCVWDLSKDPAIGGESVHEVLFIPVESSINCNLKEDTSHSDVFSGATDFAMMQEFAGTHVAAAVSYIQETDLYQYNTVYSEENDLVRFFACPYDYSSVDVYDCRIKVSNFKMNGEDSDSWTKFNANEYIDVDTAFGNINNLCIFKDQLIFFQEHAFGTLSVNERSLISDNNPGKLVLGTGDVLSRYDYISKSVGNVHKQGVVHSPNSMYWFYDNEKALYRYSGTEMPLSKAKGMQSWFNNNFTTGDNMFAIYDNEYNEVIFTIDGTDTIVYSEALDVFSAFYDCIPKAYIKLYNDRYLAISSDRKDCYIQNSIEENRCVFWGNATEVESTVKYFVNDNYMHTKVFDNIEYSSIASNATYQDVSDETWQDLRVMDDYQNSDWVTLIPGTNIERRERSWTLAVPRDAVKIKEITDTDITAVGSLDQDQIFKKRMRDKYMSVELKYDNEEQYAFTVPYINTKYRISYR